MKLKLPTVIFVGRKVSARKVNTPRRNSVLLFPFGEYRSLSMLSHFTNIYPFTSFSVLQCLNDDYSRIFCVCVVDVGDMTKHN